MKLACFSLIMSGLLMFVSVASADVIEFPEEELARESVYPVFDHPIAVRNRHIVTEGKIELAAQLGWTLNDPFFDPLNYGGQVSYHFDENHGANLLFNLWKQGPSRYSEQLQTDPNIAANRRPNLHLAPSPEWMGLLSYQITAFYGKLSLTKDLIMNLSLFGLAGVGGMAIGEKTVPVFSLGFGQKFFFSRKLSLRAGFRLLTYSGPDPLKNDQLKNKTEPQPASEFGSSVFFRTLFTVGVAYLL